VEIHVTATLGCDFGARVKIHDHRLSTAPIQALEDIELVPYSTADIQDAKRATGKT
jgi:hypothetical protein